MWFMAGECVRKKIIQFQFEKQKKKMFGKSNDTSITLNWGSGCREREKRAIENYCGHLPHAIFIFPLVKIFVIARNRVDQATADDDVMIAISWCIFALST
jgi:hypothetical protein